MPLLMALALGSFHDKRGAASALYGSIQMLIGFLGSALVGVIHGPGELILSGGYLLFGALAFVYFLVYSFF